MKKNKNIKCPKKVSLTEITPDEDLAAKISCGNDHYKYFQNTECPFFPCHDGVPIEEYNCLFCYCPLYSLGTECGGDFEILENGLKDCSKCTIPHQKKYYSHIVTKAKEMIKETTKKNLKEKGDKVVKK